MIDWTIIWESALFNIIGEFCQIIQSFSSIGIETYGDHFDIKLCEEIINDVFLKHFFTQSAWIAYQTNLQLVYFYQLRTIITKCQASSADVYRSMFETFDSI
jgi:hypothetical protein